MKVKITRAVNVELPMLIECKKTGHLDKFVSDEWYEGHEQGTGERFCQVGAYYELIEIEDALEDPTFVIRTESKSFDIPERIVYTPHEMDYEFMAEYFEVPF